MIGSSPAVSGTLRITPVGSTTSTHGSATSVIGTNVAGDRRFTTTAEAEFTLPVAERGVAQVALFAECGNALNGFGAIA